jgi:hypothetical protein
MRIQHTLTIAIASALLITGLAFCQSPPVSMLALIDSACQQLGSNATLQTGNPTAISSSKLVTTCTVHGDNLACTSQGQDSDTTFNGKRSATVNYNILINDEKVLAAAWRQPLGAEELVVFKEMQRYVFTATSFTHLPMVLQKHCVGSLKELP